MLKSQMTGQRNQFSLYRYDKSQKAFLTILKVKQYRENELYNEALNIRQQASIGDTLVSSSSILYYKRFLSWGIFHAVGLCR